MSKTGDVETFEEVPSNLIERWIWKDDTNTLELTSCNLVRLSSLNQNKKTTKGAPTPRSTSNVLYKGQRQMIGSRPGQSFGTTATKWNVSPPKIGTRGRAAQEHIITMNDVKNVVKNHPIRKDSLNLPMLQELYSSRQFDDFLWATLNYFDAFFEKKGLEEKPKPMAVEPSLAEKKALALVSSKEEEAKKSLAQCYGVLVLGLGLEDGHHMHCGRKRSSATQKDREQYETLYNFVSNVTWVTFRRPSIDVIEKELGRLLRSDTFNSAARPNNIKEVYAKDRLKDSAKQTLTPAEYRRLQPKRPAIKSIINQRSPVLVSLLPTSAEAAERYTNRKKALPLTNIDPQKSSDKSSQAFCKRVGIIGESIAGFNAENLIPIGDEQDSGQAMIIPDDVTSKESVNTSTGLYGQEGTEPGQQDVPVTHQMDSLITDEKFS